MKNISKMLVILFSVSSMLLFLNACGSSSSGSGSGGDDPADAVPVSPVNISITGYDSSIQIKWDNVTAADSYEVYWSDTNDVASANKIEQEIVLNQYTLLQLVNGQTYYVWIKAVNSLGSSEYSTVSSASPRAASEVPGDPAAPAVVSFTEGAMTLQWDAVPDAASYNIYISAVNDSSGAYLAAPQFPGTACILGSLSWNTTYYVWIKAVNSAGTSDFSPAATAVPQAVVPAAPEVQEIKCYSEQLVVTWGQAQGAESYAVWYNTTDDPDSAVLYSGDITGLTCTLDGLTNDTEYFVWITAANTKGTSAFGTVASATPLNYQVGDTGPAGGYIFYDDEADGIDNYPGYRYLEVTSEYMGVSVFSGFVFGVGNVDARLTCQRYSYNGFTDWYMPDLNEVMFIYSNLHKVGKGNFSSVWYWTSTEYSSTLAYVVHFVSGGTDEQDKGINHQLRAIRKF